jgi:uncharacterized protein (DUF302 family)
VCGNPFHGSSAGRSSGSGCATVAEQPANGKGRQKAIKGIPMPIRHVDIERFSVVSTKPFEQVVARVSDALGHPDMRAMTSGVREAKTYSEVEALIHSMVGPSDLIEMLGLDIGEVLRKAAGPSAPRSFRFIAGNPVTMNKMVEHVPDAASYAPVTILVDERPDGVHLSYDRMVSHLRPYANEDALRVAASLDANVEALLLAAASNEFPAS